MERREAAEISARKKSIIGILSNVAELGAGRMEETIGKASLRDAAIGTGIAVDKMLALTGQTPAVQIANIVLPTEEERAERRALHDNSTKSRNSCAIKRSLLACFTIKTESPLNATRGGGDRRPATPRVTRSTGG